MKVKINTANYIKYLEREPYYTDYKHIIQYDTDTQSYVRDDDYHAFCEDFVQCYAAHIREDDSKHDAEIAENAAWENLEGQLIRLRQVINEQNALQKKH